MPEEIMSPPNLNLISRTKFIDKRESEVLISNIRIKSIPKETMPLLKGDQEKSKDINSGVDLVTEEIRLDFQRLEAEAEMRKTLWTCEQILWSEINHKKMYEALRAGERTMPIQGGLMPAVDYEKKLKEYISRSMPIRRGFMPALPEEVREMQQKDYQKKSEETISRTEDMRKEIMSALQQKIIEMEQKDCQMKEDTIARLSYLKTMEENEGGTDSMKKEKEEAEFEYRKMLDLTPEEEDIEEEGYLDDVEGITEDEIEELFSKMKDGFVLSTSALYARWIEKMDELLVEDSARKGLEKYNMEHGTDYVVAKITDRQYHQGLVSFYHINFIAKSPSTNNDKEMFFAEARRTTKGNDVTVCRKLEEAVGIYRGCRFCTSDIFHPCGVNLNPEPIGPLRQPCVTISLGSL